MRKWELRTLPLRVFNHSLDTFWVFATSCCTVVKLCQCSYKPSHFEDEPDVKSIEEPLVMIVVKNEGWTQSELPQVNADVNLFFRHISWKQIVFEFSWKLVASVEEGGGRRQNRLEIYWELLFFLPPGVVQRELNERQWKPFSGFQGAEFQTTCIACIEMTGKGCGQFGGGREAKLETRKDVFVISGAPSWLSSFFHFYLAPLVWHLKRRYTWRWDNAWALWSLSPSSLPCFTEIYLENCQSRCTLRYNGTEKDIPNLAVVVIVQDPFSEEVEALGIESIENGFVANSLPYGTIDSGRKASKSHGPIIACHSHHRWRMCLNPEFCPHR